MQIRQTKFMTTISMLRNGYLPTGTGFWSKCVQFAAGRGRNGNQYSERIVRDSGGRLVKVEHANESRGK